MKSKAVLIILSLLFSILLGCNEQNSSQKPNSNFLYSGKVTLDNATLADKIKGGWAGQVIGCTYGGPTEFRFCGTMIQDYTPIPWDENRMKWYFNNAPGLYDDVYMDLTFVAVIEKEGLEAPAISHAKAFANAEYKLWHANQAARYNILNGMEPPASGFWENNPHSEDLDFQIEADFAGLMSPAMVNVASKICDTVGHIMNYGDGWYGGVYVAAMYSLAFISDDIEFVVKEGLKTIPQQSEFYKCISDVIDWYHTYPEDWKRTWFECEKKWSSDIGCPDGVFVPFDIDAKINSAYIVIGLLYGEGDYGKTIDISTRCGQDSDCNPASAAGILGTMLGYSNIPDYWKQGLNDVEDIDFKYTSISLSDVYKMGYDHAIENLTKHGGEILENYISIQPQEPVAVKFEKGFENHSPAGIVNIDGDQKILNIEHSDYSFEFNGSGFVVKGRSVASQNSQMTLENTPKIAVYVDGILSEEAILPTDFTRRRHEICWKYNLKPQMHQVEIRFLNPSEDTQIVLDNILIYKKTL